MSEFSTENPIPTSKDRRRSARPERIWIGGVEFERNDVAAREQAGASERTINRGDKHGAPYTYFAGVKYRPVKQYHQFLLEQIQVRNLSPKKRRGHR
jgi:hypothetical protein